MQTRRLLMTISSIAVLMMVTPMMLALQLGSTEVVRSTALVSSSFSVFAQLRS
jgi:hypothetical protein